MNIQYMANLFSWALILSLVTQTANGQVLKKIFFVKPLCQNELIFESKMIPGTEVHVSRYDSISNRFWLSNNTGIISFKSYYSRDNSIDSTDLYYYFWPKSTVDYIKKRYGTSAWKNVLNQKVLIGWPRELCRYSWGEPNDINKTTTSSGTHEQWVYSSNYLYFENGKLTAIQN
jgi:hypothetical protein